VSVRIVRLGSPRSQGEGLRIGTVRRPPRGVPKKEFSRRDFYDVWLPLLSPTGALVNAARSARDAAAWRRFARQYRSEMNQPEAARTLDLLAALSHSADFSVGCYCADESYCHRSILRELLLERGAKLEPPAPEAHRSAF
jgi:uncharacterized protein YeaO (DUF488 family)